ncbi:DNA-directed RNA polymerase subunit alpha [Mycoplasma sp. Pen4]|uniref:DNA-directed RNA polymerase subunit alpha n=1 Tax=Mycoplasma sp. Pen4 TaxID=640330 RepID=UPI0016548793|nr:DNA-directed RNA polymerase subunit alpha [Mycoplasma sp. Pen4]QNM93438.1 DNA-directed RNA polymerase subunit alpha [Mycoplasma sp. Pen4]
MERMKKLVYLEKPQIKETSDFVTEFSLQGLERGFANTLGVALRRVLLSSITGLAPFCVRIEGVNHEFQVIKDVVEDVPSLLMNLRDVRFTYNPEIVGDDEIVKVTLQSDVMGPVTSASMQVVSHPGVEIVDRNVHIAEVMSDRALKLEIYLRPGRGFMTFDQNKSYLQKRRAELDTNISDKKAEFIAVDSKFSPIKKVSYTVTEMNSASPKIEEKLDLIVTTDGTIKAKDAIKSASEILIGLFEVIGDVDRMNVDIFEVEEVKEEAKQEDDIDISQLNLSVRSANALKRIKKTKLSEIASLSMQQLEQTKNLGKKSIQEIVDKLKEYGYELKEGDE